MDYKAISNRLQDILNMKERIVGIKLSTDAEIPTTYTQDKQYTFCQFVMKAREGEKLAAFKDNISCANGSSALGFRPVPEKLLNGVFLEKVGSFQKDGAIKTMELMPRFEQDAYTSILVSPLDDMDFDPDVVVFETNPEVVMLLSLASLHTGGGRLEFSTSISNGTCVDMTVVPTQTGKPNVSMGCYGCRNATSVPAEHMYASFPTEYLEELVSSLESLNEKVIPRTREKMAYNKLK